MSRVIDWASGEVNFLYAERGTSYSSDPQGKPRTIQPCEICKANGERRESFETIEWVHTAKIRPAVRHTKDGPVPRFGVPAFEITSSCKRSKAGLSAKAAPSIEEP